MIFVGKKLLVNFDKATVSSSNNLDRNMSTHQRQMWCTVSFHQWKQEQCGEKRHLVWRIPLGDGDC